jgi:hypothetical protein
MLALDFDPGRVHHVVTELEKPGSGVSRRFGFEGEPTWARNSLMSADRYWILLSRFLTMAANWPTAGGEVAPSRFHVRPDAFNRLRSGA